jgi:hypothetical protein
MAIYESHAYSSKRHTYALQKLYICLDGSNEHHVFKRGNLATHAHGTSEGVKTLQNILYLFFIYL